MTTALLQTTYFGPVQWYQKLKRYDHCVIEQYDSYQKQTYRNRCVIATANGLQALTVPVSEADLSQPLCDSHGQWVAGTDGAGRSRREEGRGKRSAYQ